ncbi:MAG: hypothetical protein CMK07_12410 [Ponticaulis sp.]|nr:hypothetical protein [Ponticaulis sp.]
MLHQSTRKLIDKLVEMTASSKIIWREGDDGTCLYDTEGYRVTIGSAPSRVVLLDAGGRVLETVGDGLLATAADDEGLLYSAKVDKLVSDAQRALTGSEDVMERLVSALGGPADTHADVDEEEEVYEPQTTSYPDQPEMASRVASLAQRLNSGVPLEDVSEPEEEVVEVEAETQDVEAAEEPAAQSVWNVPQSAQDGVSETVEDFVEDTEDAGFTPIEDADDAEFGANDDLPAVDRVAAPVAEEPAASEDDVIAEAESMAEEPVAGEVEPFEPSPGAFVHEAPFWTGSSQTIDAAQVTPASFVTPLVEPAAQIETSEVVAEGQIFSAELETAEPIISPEEMVTEDADMVSGGSEAASEVAFGAELAEAGTTDDAVELSDVVGLEIGDVTPISVASEDVAPDAEEVTHTLNGRGSDALGGSLAMGAGLTRTPAFAAEPVDQAKEDDPADSVEIVEVSFEEVTAAVSEPALEAKNVSGDFVSDASAAVTDTVAAAADTIAEAATEVTSTVTSLFGPKKGAEASTGSEVEGETEQAEETIGQRKSIYKYNPWM